MRDDRVTSLGNFNEYRVVCVQFERACPHNGPSVKGIAISQEKFVVNVLKLIRNGVAGALITAMPITSTVAAVRPNAAVPTAGSVGISAQGESAASVPWLPIGIIVATLTLGIYIAATKSKGHATGALSRG
jgi:hypothetical protein